MTFVKNSALNMIGYLFPALIAFPSFGYISRSLGAERFGMFLLFISILGYSGIFDGGITRAVIRDIAIYRFDENEKKNVIATSTISIFILSCSCSFILMLFSGLLSSWLNVSVELSEEFHSAIVILLLNVPLALVNQVWLSILEGEEKFKLVNIQKTIIGVLLVVFPVVFVSWKPSLYYAIIGLLIGRSVSLIINYFLLRSVILNSGLSFNKKTFSRLVRFGGWITLSNFIGPIMVYFDRFLISNVLGGSSVAYYSAPAELVSRMSIIPQAISRVIFPRLSCFLDATEKGIYLRQIYIYTFCLCLLVVIPVFFYADIIMNVWMGGDYIGRPVLVLKILLVGYFMNAMAQIPYSTIQAEGKSRLTAIIHTVELLPYILCLYILVKDYGIVGAAIVWSLRAGIDCIVLFYFSIKLTTKCNY